jgi:hypothetical protein
MLVACSSDRSSDPAQRSEQRAAPAPVERSTAPQALPSQASPAPQSRAAVALAAARKKSSEEQRAVIVNLIESGVFAQVELNEGIPRVFLRPAFNLLTPEDKHLYLATVYALAFPDGAGPGTADRVVLLDAVSGDETGAFTETGFQTK